MEMKRILLATVCCFILLAAAGFVIHGKMLEPTYQQMRDSGFSFRSPEDFQKRFWIILLSDLIFAALFVCVYTRGVENKPWMGQGIRYGILATFLTVIPQTLNQYVVYKMSHRLAVHWMIAGLVVLIIMGIVTAGICQKKAA